MKVGLASWLAGAAGAAGAKLRTEALRDFLDAWEAEHGALTPDEIERAEAELARADGRVGGRRGHRALHGWTHGADS